MMCLVVNREPGVVATAPQIPRAVKGFYTWLKDQSHRDDAVGILARHANDSATKGRPVVRVECLYPGLAEKLAWHIGEHLSERADLVDAAKAALSAWFHLRCAEEEATVAVHEAGHAVAASLLGRPVEFVTIISEANTLGCCHYEDEPGPLSAQRIERDLIITFAGEVAEKVYTGRRVASSKLRDDSRYADHLFMLWDEVVGRELPEEFRHWADDYVPTDEEMDALMEFDLQQQAEHERVLRKRTSTLVREHWPLVEAVAAVLLKDRHLTGEDVLRIVDTGIKV